MSMPTKKQAAGLRRFHYDLPDEPGMGGTGRDTLAAAAKGEK